MSGATRNPIQFLKSKFDKESKTLFKNSGWVFTSTIVGSGLAFLRAILIARLLGVELLGVYTLAIAFVLTTQELMRLNVSMGLIKFGAAYIANNRKDKVASVIKMSLLLSSGSALASVVLLGAMILISYDTFLPAPGLALPVLLFSIANGMSFVDAISKASLKLHYKFKTNSVIQIIMDIIEFSLIAITLFTFKNNLIYFFYASIIARMINSLVCNYAAWTELKPELQPYWKSSKLQLISEDKKEYLRFVFSNSLSSSIKVLMNQGDVLLLGNIAGTGAVGLYSTAKKLAYSLLTVTDPLVNAIFPQFSMLIAKKEFSKVKVMLRKLSLLTLGPATLFVAISYFFKEELIVLFFGPEFADAALPFFYLMITAVQASILFWALPLIQSLGLADLRLKVYLSAIVVGAFIAFLLTPEWGPTGTAIGVLAANVYINLRFIYVGVRSISKTN